MEIVDPCSTAVFETDQDAQTLSFEITERTSQVLKLRTDVERLHPGVVCPISAVVSPAVAYVQVMETTITVDPTLMTAADNGSHTFTVSGTLVGYPNVPAVDVVFYVEICAV